MESIKFRRKVVLIRAIAVLCTVLLGFYLILAPERGEFGWFGPIYYVLIFVLSIWFYGPLFCILTFFLFSNSSLVSFHQYRVLLRNGKSIPWSNIRKIEVIGITTTKFAQPQASLYRFTLLDRTYVDVSTYFLLTNRELTDGVKKLRTTWSLNKHRKTKD